MDRKVLWAHVTLSGDEIESTSGFLKGANPVDGEMVLGDSEDGLTVQEMLADAEEDAASWDCVVIETGDYEPTIMVQAKKESSFLKVGIFPSPKNDPDHKAIKNLIESTENSADEEFFDVVINKSPKNDFSFGAGF